MISERYSHEAWTKHGKRVVPVPTRHLRVMDAASEFGILGRWIFGSDLQRLLSTRPATSKTCWEILEAEKSFYRRKTGAIRQVANETGILVRPNQELLVFTAPTKSVVLQVMSQIKYSFGSLGVTVVHHPVPGLNFRYAIVEVHDKGQWQKFECSGQIGDDYWHISSYRDPNPLVGVVPTEEVDQKLGHTRTIAPPPPPKREKYRNSDRWTVDLPPDQVVVDGGQLGDLKRILQALHGRTVDWYFITNDVSYAASHGKLTTTQLPDRIIGYYRNRLIKDGILRRAK